MTCPCLNPSCDEKHRIKHFPITPEKDKTELRNKHVAYLKPKKLKVPGKGVSISDECYKIDKTFLILSKTLVMTPESYESPF